MHERRYQLSVCPHDTAKFMVEWFHFNTYLQRRLECRIHFEPQENFNVERELVLGGDFHITYANPFSACAYIRERGFIPVAKPVGIYDETILVARPGVGVPGHRPLKVASASDKLIIHALGLSLLDQLAIPKEECEFALVGNHMKAAQAVIRGEADLGFVFNETWHGMAGSTRSELERVAETEDRIAFHCFLIAPEWAERREDVQQLLLGMADDPKGSAILQSLHFTALEPLSGDALDTLRTILAYRDGAG